MSISRLVRTVAFATPALAIVAVALALTIGSRSDRVAADVPHAGLDFSIAVALTQDGPNICSTAGGPMTCEIPGATDAFTVKVFLDSRGDVTYFGYDAAVLFSMVQPGAVSTFSSASWPDCGFPAAILANPKLMRIACAAGISVPASSYQGQLGRLGGVCVSGGGTVALQHGESDTGLDGAHSEAATGTEVLTLNCGGPSESPTPIGPTNTVGPTDTPGPTNTPAPPTNTSPPTSTRTPTRTPTNTPTSPPKELGDVNDDGNVNSIDAQLVLQYTADLLSTLENIASADMNDDGSVTSVDAAIILQIEAGLL